MLTPQEVLDKKFSKAVFGGYDMSEVDSFLDALYGDYDKLYKETAILKSKLKTLADKVEEYRSVDDVMRQTLLTAKKTADEMSEKAKTEAETLTAQAKSESEKMLADAKMQSERMTSTAREEAEKHMREILADIKNEEQRLIEVRSRIRRYATAAAEACKHELDVLNALAQAAGTPEKPVPVVKIDILAPVLEEETAVEAVELEAEVIEAAEEKAAEATESVIEEAAIETPVEIDFSETESADDGDGIRITGRRVVPLGNVAENPQIIEGDGSPLDYADPDSAPTLASPLPREIDVGGMTVSVFEIEPKSDGNVFRDIFGEDDDE